jgi:hypothetical protein
MTNPRCVRRGWVNSRDTSVGESALAERRRSVTFSADDDSDNEEGEDEVVADDVSAAEVAVEVLEEAAEEATLGVLKLDCADTLEADSGAFTSGTSTSSMKYVPSSPFTFTGMTARKSESVLPAGTFRAYSLAVPSVLS